MSLINELIPASFKGISFLMDESTISAGRKTVTHEFPNSDRRYVEDLGKLKRVFTIRGVVTGPNYKEKKEALQKALESHGLGNLVHPFFGPIEVYAKPYTLTENLTRLGEAQFQMVFERAEPNIYPQSAASSLSQIGDLSNGVLDSLSFDIANGFSVSRQFPTNFTSAKSLLTTVTDAFGFNTSKFVRAADAINEFSALLNEYDQDQNTLIRNPDQLGTRTVELQKSADELGNTPEQSYNISKEFFTYGEDLKEIPQTTVPRIERKTNQTIIIYSIQIGALSQAYRNAAFIEYENIQNLDKTNNQLENQFRKINNNFKIPQETRDLLIDLRNQVRIFLEETRLNINDVTPINTKNQPLSVIAYQYYGSTENTQKLFNLNRLRSSAFVQGEVNILTP